MFELRHQPAFTAAATIKLHAVSLSGPTVTDHDGAIIRQRAGASGSGERGGGSSRGGNTSSSQNSGGSSNKSSNSNSSGGATTASWRKRGERLRQTVIENDERMGGQAFLLSSSCPIYRYYHVADKVLDQFLHHPIDSSDELMEAYTVGHRLVKFLSNILPTHDDYFSEDVEESQARNRSLEQLVAVLKYLDQIAILIDKQAHEDYIRSVLTEQAEIDDFADDDGGDTDDTDRNNPVAAAARQVSLREESYYSDDDNTDFAGQQEAVQLSSETGSRMSLLSAGAPVSGSHSRNAAESEINTFAPLQRPRQREVTPENSFTDSHGSAVSSVANSSTASSPKVTNPWLSSPKSSSEPKAQPLTPLVQSARMARLEHRREKPGFVESAAGSPSRPFGSSDAPEYSSRGEAMNTQQLQHQTLSPPGNSVVQSRVRAWPPKPDPPAERLYTGKRANASLDQSYSSVDTSPKRLDKSQISLSSVESTPSQLQQSITSASSVESNHKRLDRPSTPLPLEQHAIAAASPELVQPLLLLDDSPDTARLRFKPLTELQVQASEKERESAFKKATPASGRVTWADKKFSGLMNRRADRSGFSSSSCSSREEDVDYDALGVDPNRFQSVLASAVVPSRDGVVAVESSDASAAPSTRHEDVRGGSSTNVSRTPVITTTSDWRVGNDTTETFEIPTQAESIKEQGVRSVESTESQRVLETINAIPQSGSLNQPVSRNAAEKRMNVATDSNGFPIADEDALSPHQSPSAFGALNESRDNSVFSKVPEMQDTSGSVSSQPERHVDETSKPRDLLAGNVSFASVDFDGLAIKRNEKKGPSSAIQEGTVSTRGVSSRIRSDGSTHDRRFPEEKSRQSLTKTSSSNEVQSSSSYAPSVADWGAEDDEAFASSTKSDGVAVDSMGFPIRAESALKPSKISVPAFGFLSGNKPVAGGHTSYAAPQTLVVESSFDGKLSQPGWVDVWETVVDNKNFATDAPDKVPKHGTLSEDSMVRFWTSKGQYPSSDPAVKSAGGDMKADQETQQYPSVEVAISSDNRSSTHSREPHRPEQRDAATSKTTTIRATNSENVLASLESPIYVEGPVSPYMSESKTEQRLKAAVTNKNSKSRHGRKAPDAAAVPALELTPSASLELMQNRSSKSSSDRQRLGGGGSRGNKLLCRKQKGPVGSVGVRECPNELDSLDEASLLMVKSQGPAYHFKSCVRCLID